jgi:N-acyl homoserine lactone hydrolase
MVSVEAIRTAELAIPAAYVFRPPGNSARRLAGVLASGTKRMRSPCLAYVVRHPAAGTVLIDTGFHQDAATDLRRDFGLPMSLMFRGIDAAEPFDSQLREREVDPLAVERVVMTHLHVDHTSGMRLLPNARFVCTREEWRAATGSRASAKGYVGHHLPPADRVDLVDFDLSPAEPHGPFVRTIDLLGDGSVRLVSTPGHTAGHMSVLLRLADERQVLLVGDAAYTLRSIDEQILPLLTTGDSRYAESLGQLKAFAEAHPEATLVPSHDPTAWHALSAL